MAPPRGCRPPQHLRAAPCLRADRHRWPRWRRCRWHACGWSGRASVQVFRVGRAGRSLELPSPSATVGAARGAPFLLTPPPLHHPSIHTISTLSPAPRAPSTTDESSPSSPSGRVARARSLAVTRRRQRANGSQMGRRNQSPDTRQGAEHGRAGALSLSASGVASYPRCTAAGPAHRSDPARAGLQRCRDRDRDLQARPGRVQTLLPEGARASFQKESSMSAVRYQVHAAVAEITLEPPPVNALTEEMVGQLLAALQRAAADAGVRAVVLASAVPRRFCAGLDLQALNAAPPEKIHALLDKLYTALCDAQFRLGKPSIAAVAAASPPPRNTLANLYTALGDAQFRLGKPSIAAVAGAARGGGMTLAISCDMLVAGRSATFGHPEIDLGLLPPIP